MRIKSYFSGTVEAALQLAGRELGEEALLLSARASAADVRHLGAYEVVVGVPDPPKPGTAAAESSVISNANLGDFLRRIDCSPAVIHRAFSLLDGRAATDREVANVLNSGIRFEDARTTSEPNVVVFAGPAGGGKTTTLCKLAIRESPRRPITIIDTDSRKIGANQSLRRVAEIAGVEYQCACQPDEIAVLLSRAEGRTVLIDTPGFSPASASEADRWVQPIRGIPKLVTHLVLSAAARTADLMLTLRRYAMFAPQRLIFTRLDECASAGGVLSAATDSGLPLSWFGTGQSLTGDLEPAGADRLFRTLFEAPAMARQAAAAGGSR